MEEEFFGNFLLQDPREMVADKTEVKALNAEIAASQLKISQYGKTIQNLLKMVNAETEQVPEFKIAFENAVTGRDAEKAHLDELIGKQSKLEMSPSNFDDLKKLVHAFDTEPDGATTLGEDLKLNLSPQARAFDDAVQRMTETLKSNEVRKKIRTMLPTLIGKIIVDTRNRDWKVFNHSGKCVYQSLSHDVGP